MVDVDGIDMVCLQGAWSKQCRARFNIQLGKAIHKIGTRLFIVYLFHIFKKVKHIYNKIALRRCSKYMSDTKSKDFIETIAIIQLYSIEQFLIGTYSKTQKSIQKY